MKTLQPIYFRFAKVFCSTTQLNTLRESVKLPANQKSHSFLALYRHPYKASLLSLALTAILCNPLCLSAAPKNKPTKDTQSASQSNADQGKEDTPKNSILTGELMMEILLGELNNEAGVPATGFALILDAARKTEDSGLFKRAVEIALQARSGPSALEAARAWKNADPTSKEANRFVLDILIALNKIDQTEEPLRTDLLLTPQIEQLKAIKPKTTGKFNISSWRPPYTFFKNDVAKVMDNPVYIFESRGLQSTFSLGSKPNISDALHNYFAKVNDILSSYENDTTIEVLHLIYQNKEGNGFFKKSPADNLLRMTSAASGYQSAIPIELIIKHYHDKKKKSKTFIIEEPELNLFPETQMNLVNFLVSEINSTHSSLVLPTHSPYILTSLNNCMLAYEVGNKPGNNDKVGKILEEKYWMNPDDVSAYRLKSDGTTENIVDREEGLIKAEMIDGVSGILNEKFEELLNLEFSKKRHLL